MSKQLVFKLANIAPELNDVQLKTLFIAESHYKLTKAVRALALNTCKLGNLPIPDHIADRLKEKQDKIAALISNRVPLKRKQKLIINNLALLRNLLAILKHVSETKSDD